MAKHPGDAELAKGIAAATTGTPATPSRKVKNPEAVAISDIADVLEPLNYQQRRRVMTWANAVYMGAEEAPKVEYRGGADEV